MLSKSDSNCSSVNKPSKLVWPCDFFKKSFKMETHGFSIFTFKFELISLDVSEIVASVICLSVSAILSWLSTTAFEMTHGARVLGLHEEALHWERTDCGLLDFEVLGCASQSMTAMMFWANNSGHHLWIIVFFVSKQAQKSKFQIQTQIPFKHNVAG